MSVFAGPQHGLVLLFLLSAGFPQAQQHTPHEVSWSRRDEAVDGSLCQAEKLLPVGFGQAMLRRALYSPAKPIMGLAASTGASSAWASTGLS